MRAWWVGVCGLLISGMAFAQESGLERAKRLFGEAEAAEQGKSYQEALDKLKQVRDIKATAGVVFHIAFCEEHLGLLADALGDYEASLKLAEEQGADDVKGPATKGAEALRGRVPRAKLRITPAGVKAEVTVDGKAVPDTSEVRVDPDREHVLVVRAPGGQPVEKRIRLREGETTEVAVELPTEASSAGVASGSGDAAPAGTRRGPPLGTWIAGGAGVALGVAGTIAFVVAGSNNSDGQAACAKPETCDPSVRDSVRTLDRAALALWIGAGVGLATGVTLWILDKPSSKPASSAKNLGLTLTPGRATLVTQFY